MCGLPLFPQNDQYGLFSRGLTQAANVTWIGWKASHPPRKLLHGDPLVVWRAQSKCVIVTDTGLNGAVTCVRRHNSKYEDVG